MNSKEVLTMLQQNTHNEEIEIALRHLYEKQYSYYGIAASVDLAMNYVQLKEQLEEIEKSQLDKFGLEEDLQLIEKALYHLEDIANDKAEKIIYEDNFRQLKKSLKTTIEVLIGYNDQIEVYESLIERYQVKGQEIPMAQELAGDMIQFAFQGQDKMMMNQKIKELLKLVPVRMTKDNLEIKLRESLSLFYGGHEKDLEEFLKSAVQTFIPESIEGYGQVLPEIAKQLDSMRELKFKELGQDKATHLLKELTQMSGEMECLLDLCTTMVTMLNKLLLIVVGPCQNYHVLIEQESKLSHTLKLFKELHQSYNEEAVYFHLTALEGVAERWLERIHREMGNVHHIMEQYKETLLEKSLYKQYEGLNTAELLFNPSLFAEIDEYMEDRGQQLDKAMLKKHVDDFIEQIMTCYGYLGTELRRVKVNQLLYLLPVAFRKPEELHDYLKLMLDQCHDTREQEYVFKVYQELKSEYNLYS